MEVVVESQYAWACVISRYLGALGRPIKLKSSARQHGDKKDQRYAEITPLISIAHYGLCYRDRN